MTSGTWATLGSEARRPRPDSRMETRFVKPPFSDGFSAGSPSPSPSVLAPADRRHALNLRDSGRGMPLPSPCSFESLSTTASPDTRRWHATIHSSTFPRREVSDFSASSSPASSAKILETKRLVSTSITAHHFSIAAGAPLSSLESLRLASKSFTWCVNSSIIPVRSSTETSPEALCSPAKRSPQLLKKTFRKRPTRFTAMKALSGVAPIDVVLGGRGDPCGLSSAGAAAPASSATTLSRRALSSAGNTADALTATPHLSNICTFDFSARSMKFDTASKSSPKDPPHPKTRARSLPVPSGMTPSWQFVIFLLSVSCRIHPIVPSPPQPIARKLGRSFIKSSPGPGPACDRSTI
mmetsp:Transcript_8715/g.26219  ORF Transcript_8715/g.26219 Transcript_8715/m.26219 type:complete len:353 (+) Transcript_8715:2676-3734(+)